MEILSLILPLIIDLIFFSYKMFRVKCGFSSKCQCEAENKMNKGFVVWAQYLEEGVIFHVASLRIIGPSSQLGPKIISVPAFTCVQALTACVRTRVHSSFTNQPRNLNLPTCQLAPLIPTSNTHQGTNNETFLRTCSPQYEAHVMSYWSFLLNTVKLTV